MTWIIVFLAPFMPFVILLITGVCLAVKSNVARCVLSLFLTSGVFLGIFWSWEFFHSILITSFMALLSGFLLMSTLILGEVAHAESMLYNRGRDE